jgi:very-short-patch-repair endonuclease
VQTGNILYKANRAHGVTAAKPFPVCGARALRLLVNSTHTAVTPSHSLRDQDAVSDSPPPFAGEGSGVRGMKLLARRLRERSTEAERTLWYELRGRRLNGHKFRRQQPIGSYIVDFVCLEQRLIVEIDGGHHLLQQGQDRKRSEQLRAMDFRIFRLWNDEVLTQTAPVLEAMLRELENLGSLPPHPNPSPTRGEGLKK